MVNFVKPNLLGTPKEFTNRFVSPITNGQCRDSSPLDIRKMKLRAHILYTLLKDTVQVGIAEGLSNHKVLQLCGSESSSCDLDWSLVLLLL